MSGNPEKVRKAYEQATKDLKNIHASSRNLNDEALKKIHETGTYVTGLQNNEKKKRMNSARKKVEKEQRKKIQSLFQDLDDDLPTKLAVGLAYLDMLTDSGVAQSSDQKRICELIEDEIRQGLGKKDREETQQRLASINAEFAGREDQRFEYLVETYQKKDEKQREEELAVMGNQVREDRLKIEVETKFLKQSREELAAWSSFSRPALQQSMSIEQIKYIGEQVADGVFSQEVVEKGLEEVVADPMAVTHYFGLLACDSDEAVVGYLASLPPKSFSSFENMLKMIETGGYLTREGAVERFDEGVNGVLVKKLKSASEYAVRKHVTDRAGVETYSRSEIRLIQLFFNVGLAVAKYEKDNLPHSEVMNGYIRIDGKLGKKEIEKYETNRIVMALELQSIRYGGLRHILEKLPDRSQRREVIGVFAQTYIEGRDYMIGIESLQNKLPDAKRMKEAEKKRRINFLYGQYGSYLTFLVQEKISPEKTYSYPLMLPHSPVMMSLTIPIRHFADHYKKQSEHFNRYVEAKYKETRGTVLQEQIKRTQASVSVLEKKLNEKREQLEKKSSVYEAFVKKMGSEMKNYAGLLTMAGDLFGRGSDINRSFAEAFTSQKEIVSLLNEIIEIRTEMHDVYFALAQEQFSFAGLLGDEGETLQEGVVLTVAKTLGRSYLQKNHEMWLCASKLHTSLPESDHDKQLLAALLGVQSRGSILTQTSKTQTTRDAYASFHEDVRTIQTLPNDLSYDKNTYDTVFGSQSQIPYEIQKLTKLRAVSLVGRGGGGSQQQYFDFQLLHDQGISTLQDVTSLLSNNPKYSDIKIGFVGYEDMKAENPPGYPQLQYKQPVYRPSLQHVRLYAVDTESDMLVSFPLAPALFGEKASSYLPYWLNHHAKPLASKEQVAEYFTEEQEKADVLERQPVITQLGDLATEMHVRYQPFFEMMNSLSAESGAVTSEIKKHLYKVNIPDLLSFNSEVSRFLGDKKVQEHLKSLNIKEVLQSCGLYVDGVEKQLQTTLKSVQSVADFFASGGAAEQTLRFFQNEKNIDTRGSEWKDKLLVLCVVIFVSVAVMMATGGVAGVFLGAAAGMLAHEGMVREMNAINKCAGYSPYKVGSDEFTTFYEQATPLIARQNGEMETEEMVRSYGRQFVQQIAFQFGAMGFGKFIGGPLRGKAKLALSASAKAQQFFALIDDIALRGVPGEQQFFSKFLGEYVEEMYEESTLEQIAAEIHPALQYLVMMRSASKGGGVSSGDIFNYYGLNLEEVKKTRDGTEVHMSVNAEHFDSISELMNQWAEEHGALVEEVISEGNAVTVTMNDGTVFNIESTEIPNGFRQWLGSYAQYIEPEGQTESGEPVHYRITKHPERILKLLEAGGYIVDEEDEGSCTLTNVYGETLSFTFEKPPSLQLYEKIQTYQDVGLLEQMRTTPESERGEREESLIFELRTSVMNLAPEEDDVRLRIGAVLLERKDGFTPEETEVILQAHRTDGRVGTYRVLSTSGLFSHDEMRILCFWGVCGYVPGFERITMDNIRTFEKYITPPLEDDDAFDHKYFELFNQTPYIYFEKLMFKVMRAGVNIPSYLLQSSLFLGLLPHIQFDAIPDEVFGALDFTKDEAFRGYNRSQDMMRFVSKLSYDMRPSLFNTLLQYSFINDTAIGYGTCSDLPKTMIDSIEGKGGCLIKADGVTGYVKIDAAVPTSLQLIDHKRKFVSFTDIVPSIMHDMRSKLAARFGTMNINAGFITDTEKREFLSTYTHPAVKRIGFTALGFLCVELHDTVHVGSREHDDVDIVGQDVWADYTHGQGLELMQKMRNKADSILGDNSVNLEIFSEDKTYAWIISYLTGLKESGNLDRMKPRAYGSEINQKTIQYIQQELTDEERQSVAEVILGRKLSEDEWLLILALHINTITYDDVQKYEKLRQTFSSEDSQLLMRWGVCGFGTKEEEEMKADSAFTQIMRQMKKSNQWPNYSERSSQRLHTHFHIEMRRVRKLCNGDQTAFIETTRQMHQKRKVDFLMTESKTYEVHMNRNAIDFYRDANFSLSLVDTTQSPPLEVAIVSFLPGPEGTLDIVQIQGQKGVEDLPQNPRRDQFLVRQVRQRAMLWGFSGVRVLRGERNFLYMFPRNIDQSFTDDQLRDHKKKMEMIYTVMPEKDLGFTKDDSGWYNEYIFDEESKKEVLQEKVDFMKGQFENIKQQIIDRTLDRRPHLDLTEKMYYDRKSFLNQYTSLYNESELSGLHELSRSFRSYFRPAVIDWVRVSDFAREYEIIDYSTISLYRILPQLMNYAQVTDFPRPPDMRKEMLVGKGQNGFILSFRPGEAIKVPIDEELIEDFDLEAELHEGGLWYLKKGKKEGRISDRIHIPMLKPYLKDEMTPYFKMDLIEGYPLTPHHQQIVSGTSLDLSDEISFGWKDGQIIHGKSSLDLELEVSQSQERGLSEQQRIPLLEEVKTDLEAQFMDIPNRKERLFRDDGTGDAFISTFYSLYQLGKLNPQYSGLYEGLVDAMKYFLTQDPPLAHHDISMDNVMLAFNQETQQYDLYILDFGIAKFGE